MSPNKSIAKRRAESAAKAEDYRRSICDVIGKVVIKNDELKQV